MTGRLILLTLLLMLVACAEGDNTSNTESVDIEPITSTATYTGEPPTPIVVAEDIADSARDSGPDVLLLPADTAEPASSAPQQQEPTMPPQIYLNSSALQTTWTPSGPTVTPFPTVTSIAAETIGAIAATPEALATAVLEEDIRGDHFWLARPFSSAGGITSLPNIYYYGTTALGLQPHHGVDIENPLGTNVRAVASGRVFYAGDDLSPPIFGPQTNFYGNVVVIEHEFELPDKPGTIFRFYTLYGHLSQFFVRAGDVVQQFDEIGTVGQEGVALGPHLHLEIRIGEDPYDYNSTYNPNLWLQPFAGEGVLAGRVLLRNGTYVPDIEIEVQQDGRVVQRTFTYHYDNVNRDPYFLENFVVPNLRAGSYDVIVKYAGRALTQPLEINPGRTTVMNQIVD